MNFKTLCLCGFVSALVFPCSLWAEVLTVDEAVTPIRVDGHLGDWPEARMFLLNRPSQVTQGKPFWKGPDDFNGRIFLCYDSLCLYLAAIVQKKGAVVNEGEGQDLWNGDCLELFLSVLPAAKHPPRLSPGDFHLGFSPGTGCRKPRIFCFNQNASIPGSRLIARSTAKGYLLEACVPLAFFEGLSIGPGKSAGLNLALDEGGALSGNLLIRMDASEDPSSWNHPSRWNEIQWGGKTEVDIPRTPAIDNGAEGVRDGTQGLTYLGVRTLQGIVLDAKGKPLSKTGVSTWPKTQGALTDEKGRFELSRIKVYDGTVLYARRDGFGTGWAPLAAKGGAVSFHLTALPEAFDPSGTDNRVLWVGRDWDPTLTGATPGFFGARGPNLLRWCPTGAELNRAEMDDFVAGARAAGAEPLVVLPLLRENPGGAAEWVRYANLEKKYKIQFWALGNGSDEGNPEAAASSPDSDPVYDYINDFRILFNAVKRLDPTVFLLGPEVGLKPGALSKDGVAPFVRYNGDIVDLISVHRYGPLGPGGTAVSALQGDARAEGSLIRSLRETISTHSEFSIPLAVTGRSPGWGPVPPKGREGDLADGFWEAFWTAETMAGAIQEHLGLNLFTGRGQTGASTPTPADWAARMVGLLLTGEKIPVQVRNPDLSAYASRDSKTGDVTLLLLNRGDRYLRPNGFLDGRDAELSVEAGLDQRIDYEVPSFSLNCLKIKADHSPGQALFYTRKMAREGKPPVSGVLKPW